MIEPHTVVVQFNSTIVIPHYYSQYILTYILSCFITILPHPFLSSFAHFTPCEDWSVWALLPADGAAAWRQRV